MKTILEIQKLDRQIRALERDVENCPASVDNKKYKALMQTGRDRFNQLESQANEIIKKYNVSNNRLSKYKGDRDIIKRKNTDSISYENISNLITDANGLLGDLSEENRRVEDLVRKSEEVVRKNADLAQKLTEIKNRLNSTKSKIEEKKQEVAPKIVELQKKIKELESKVQDKEKYAQYKELKEKGVFPVFVYLQDNFCGRCKVELPLNFIERLKSKKMLPCEHCGSIIMLEVIK